MQRREAAAPGALEDLEGKMDAVGLAIALCRPRLDPRSICAEPGEEAAWVGSREVATEGVRGAVQDHLRQRHASPGTALDALGVEAGGEVDVVGPGQATDQWVVVHGVGVWAMQPLLDAYLAERRHVHHSRLEPPASLLEGLIVELVLGIPWHQRGVGIPRPHRLRQVLERLTLKHAHHETADLRLQVVLVVDVADHGQVPTYTLRLVKDDVLMRHHCYRHAVLAEGKEARLFRPSARAHHDAPAQDLLPRAGADLPDLAPVPVKVHAHALRALQQDCPVGGGLLG
mmetsp:Transcript_90330/g.292361  ORF Transcript_90330/g.292361 Transcript_90330/m.292361 type:complete len:286 (+) Transcript_90330:1323-2180(+)